MIHQMSLVEQLTIYQNQKDLVRLKLSGNRILVCKIDQLLCNLVLVHDVHHQTTIPTSEIVSAHKYSNPILFRLKRMLKSKLQKAE
jgi:hypothetical protein